MTVLTVLAGLVLAFVVFVAAAAVADLFSEELRSRLDALPHAILRLVLHLTPEAERESRRIELEGELWKFLEGNESRPVTRLVKGCWYSGGLLPSAGRARVVRAFRSVNLERLRLFSMVIAGVLGVLPSFLMDVLDVFQSTAGKVITLAVTGVAMTIALMASVVARLAARSRRR